ncbi:hypothetical protein K1F50_01600 [Muricauda oceani]|uniref:Uncharacterized protein n=1 Tax=Flagellimonas oceani TaxID=2698672 RepID=A0A6G7J1P0_9FLAO|nr:hypothetical protein [Allomuricauda oceani]MBW8241476.1 hypothetical protein [Allomuricauda oceani]QII44528.1 hypothetical protein GVT53_07510 [Allomuricauda oceani]
MKPNRYIKAMEIGLAHENEGISYFDLVYELHGTKEKVFSKEAEITFFKWFQDNFDCEGPSWSHINNNLEFKNYLTRNENSKHYHVKDHDVNLHNLLNNLFFLKGSGAFQYQEYLELVESRKTAAEAKRQSNISIGLAIGAIIISIVFGIISLLSTQNVKIMEDKTRTQQLEKENGQLKEELYKAEMMLEAQVSDSISN